MQTCYGKKIAAEAKGKKFGWDCDRWTKETPDPGCLPTLKGHSRPRACRKLRAGEKIVGPVHRGPRGGNYFMVVDVKVYVPKGAINLEYAKKKYGSAK